MTMPHLMNCPHSPEGWCLACVGKLQGKYDAAETLLYKASPHLVNGANGHATDRGDARMILREMKKLGIDPM